MKTRNIAAETALCLFLISNNTNAQNSVDPLPSWNAGPTKEAIVAFVERVTNVGGSDYVPPAERIATFDNDGCLWSEKPVYFQLQFAIDRIKQLALKHPEWKKEQPFKAVLDGDRNTLAKLGEAGLLKLVMASHAGMTTDEFAATASTWLKSARHPRFRRPYTELVFKPMLELLEYLRANNFKTYIVSGGGIEFLRVFAKDVYGIPPVQVIGSTIKTKFDLRGEKPVIVRLPELDFVDDKAGKPIAINKFIGRRPIAAFGNSDGDLQMLQWTAAGNGPRFCLLVHHTDADREWAYDRNSHIGRLDKALDVAKQRGWTVVDMKRDWNVIYTAVHHYLHKEEKPHAAEWSYKGETGPEHWGDLNPDYALAKVGRQQSPVDIHSTVPKSLPRITFNYKPSRVHLIYNGHTIQENEDPGSFGSAGKRNFELQQFHFHSPSEHTVDGNHFPMEMHLVHKAKDGTVAVIAVFVREGKHNHAFDPIWDRLPDAKNSARDADVKFDTLALLPNDRSYYSYEGSFTTPPCTERVKWVVLKTPVAMSKQQIQRFRAVIHGNNRPVQPLNGRRIYLSN